MILYCLLKRLRIRRRCIEECDGGNQVQDTGYQIRDIR